MNASDNVGARFKSAIQSNNLKVAYECATHYQTLEKWKQLGKAAVANEKFSLAQECKDHIKGNYSGVHNSWEKTFSRL